jgi:hypothetical protein
MINDNAPFFFSFYGAAAEEEMALRHHSRRHRRLSPLQRRLMQSVIWLESPDRQLLFDLQMHFAGNKNVFTHC